MNSEQHGPVQQMFDGPVDIIADVHGEIDALEHLLVRLGYDAVGYHRQGRRLVFLGDLIDRGPNSVAVIDKVAAMMEAGHAQCILGNHELNVLRRKRAPHTGWLDGKPWIVNEVEIPQTMLPSERRKGIREFFATLPVALERDDLRVVHACWDHDAIEELRSVGDAMAVYRQAHNRIKRDLEHNGYEDEVERNLAFQNRNPVKLITSGPEVRAAEPFFASGKMRHEARIPWWEQYEDDATCVCGHYWRTPLPGKLTGDSLFNGYGEHDPLGNGNVMCIDYSVGGRYLERLNGHGSHNGSNGFHTKLCALRWPERELMFDDGMVSVCKETRANR
jgi:hypothetical protein